MAGKSLVFIFGVDLDCTGDSACSKWAFDPGVTLGLLGLPAGGGGVKGRPRGERGGRGGEEGVFFLRRARIARIAWIAKIDIQSQLLR